MISYLLNCQKIHLFWNIFPKITQIAQKGLNSVAGSFLGQNAQIPWLVSKLCGPQKTALPTYHNSCELSKTDHTNNSTQMQNDFRHYVEFSTFMYINRWRSAVLLQWRSHQENGTTSTTRAVDPTSYCQGQHQPPCPLRRHHHRSSACCSSTDYQRKPLLSVPVALEQLQQC